MINSSVIGYSSLIPLIRSVGPVFLTILLVKFLPKVDYGFFVYCFGVIGVLLSVSSLNLMYSMQVVLNKKNVSSSEVAESVFGFKLIVTISVGLLYTYFLFVTDNITRTTFLLINVLLLLRVVNDYIFGYTRAICAFKQQFIFTIFEQLLFVGCIFVISLLGNLDITTTFICYLVCQIVAIMGYLLFLSNGLFRLFPIKFSFIKVKTLLLIGLPMLPFTFSDLIVSSFFPQIIYTKFGGVEAADYAVGQKIAMLIIFPAMILNNFYLQRLTRSYEDSYRNFIVTLGIFFAVYLSSIVVIYFLLSLFSNFIITTLFDADYLMSGLVAQVLMSTYTLITLSSVVSGYFAVLNRTKIVAYIWIAVFIAFFLCFYTINFSGYIALIMTYNYILFIAFLLLIFLVVKDYVYARAVESS